MITVDKEFESLIPPLSPEEFAQLEENCVKDGIRDPLVVWDSPDGEILVDGHNRWKISASHSGIQFHVVKMHFENRDAVKEWIIKNQFGRRNIPPYMRAWLALKLKPIVAGKAEQRMKAGKADPVQSFAQGKTGDTLAKVAGVSHETIRKVETVEKSGNEAVKAAARAGEISINKAYETIKAENAALKRRVSELENQKPEVITETVTKTVEVVPDDYKDAKRKANAYDQEVKRLNDKLTAAYRERSEQGEKIRKLEDEIAEISSGTSQGQYFEQLNTVAIAFEQHCADFIRWVGGYIWITQNPGKLKPERRDSVINAVQMVYEWAGTMLHNLNTEENANEESGTDTESRKYIEG